MSEDQVKSFIRACRKNNSMTAYSILKENPDLKISSKIANKLMKRACYNGEDDVAKILLKFCDHEIVRDDSYFFIRISKSIGVIVNH